jgi:AcrR family transcriptional regulator
MPKFQRRERAKAEFREEVLAAARRVVLDEGFDALSMRKIADAIEYAPGTIYLYFDSRDAIAIELCRRGFAEFLAALAPAISISDPRDRLRELGRRYVQFGLENPQTYRLIFMERPEFLEAVFVEKDELNPGDRALQILINAFEELRASGGLRSQAESLALAESLWAAVHGVVSLKLLCKSYPRTDAHTLERVVTEAMLDGLLT